MRSDKVISIEHRKIEKFLRHFNADRMKPDIFRSGAAKSIAIESSHRIATTAFQFGSQNVRRHKEDYTLLSETLSGEEAMPIRAKYVHTNLIARDWKKLAQF